VSDLIPELVQHELKRTGFPASLEPVLTRLFTHIMQGHTAVVLADADAQALKASHFLTTDRGQHLLSMTQDRLQIARHAAQEQRIARALMHRAAQRSAATVDAKTIMPDADPSQRAAVEGASQHRFSMILGGPGTGKTTTAAALVSALCDGHPSPHPRIALLAPTGKAAVRLTSAFHTARKKTALNPHIPTDIQATTVHRQLDDLKSRDIVLVDEASMISLDLMDRLLRALNPEAALILMGDPHQLASVEAGSVFATLAEVPALKTHRFKLTQRHRIQAATELQTLQDTCLAGDVAGFFEAVESTDTHWLQTTEVERLKTTVINGYQPFLSQLSQQGDAEEPTFQVLTAIASGAGGRHRINAWMTDTLRMHGLEGVGQRILVTENQDALGLSNGDIGTVLDPVTAANRRVVFPHRAEPVNLSQVNAPESAFAISIHRAQGSEYPDVLVALSDAPSARAFQPSRELLYTALTRAKRSISLFGSQQMLTKAIQTPTERLTCLDLFLEAAATE
jgi:exodeoxyribonuclease V alpha subunit